MIETIDFSKSEQYTLSIRLSADGFSFSVFNPLGEGELSFFDRKVEESLSLTANLKQTFREIEWLKHPYRRVNILMADKRFTLVPLEFFEDEQTETLFYHNHPKRENEIVQYNILRKNNAVVLFSMDKSARSFLCEQYPDVRFYSQASSFIEHFSSKSRLGNSRKMYVSGEKSGLFINQTKKPNNDQTPVQIPADSPARRRVHGLLRRRRRPNTRRPLRKG